MCPDMPARLGTTLKSTSKGLRNGKPASKCSDKNRSRYYQACDPVGDMRMAFST